MAKKVDTHLQLLKVTALIETVQRASRALQASSAVVDILNGELLEMDEKANDTNLEWADEEDVNTLKAAHELFMQLPVQDDIDDLNERLVEFLKVLHDHQSALKLAVGLLSE